MLQIEDSELRSAVAADGQLLAEAEVERVVGEFCAAGIYKGRRVLVVIPDNTRTGPIGLAFRLLHRQLQGVAAKLDILIALGTHPPMNEAAICQRLEVTPEELHDRYRDVRVFNHEWDNPQALAPLGIIPAEEIRKLSDGLFAMDVPVSINRRVFDYDDIVIIGPVFPHEVVGFSGGNKYLFPGIGGPEVLNFFHWLGAVIMTVNVIGHKWTPVRRVVDRAGAMVGLRKRCLALVVKGQGLRGLFAGSPESAWDRAVELSAQTHIVWKRRAFSTVVSCAPPMYDELWVGAKCMYKLEPVLEPGGELIIYAPHLHEISVTHGRLIRQVGYHCRDYFLKQWDRFKDFPWGVLAHSTHVFGLGTYENGVEKARARVTLATGIPEEVCKEINLGWRDWRSMDLKAYENREDEGILLVPKSGETLYRIAE